MPSSPWLWKRRAWLGMTPSVGLLAQGLHLGPAYKSALPRNYCFPPKSLSLVPVPNAGTSPPDSVARGGNRGSTLEGKGFASPCPLPETSFLAQNNILSLGLQIFLLINYYASCQISIAITKRLIATMRCGTPLLQGNFLLFMLWHNIV